MCYGIDSGNERGQWVSRSMLLFKGKLHSRLPEINSHPIKFMVVGLAAGQSVESRFRNCLIILR